MVLATRVIPVPIKLAAMTMGTACSYLQATLQQHQGEKAHAEAVVAGEVRGAAMPPPPRLEPARLRRAIGSLCVAVISEPFFG